MTDGSVLMMRAQFHLRDGVPAMIELPRSGHGALRGLSAEITVLRSSQSDTRSAIKKIELDPSHDHIGRSTHWRDGTEKEVRDCIA